MLDDPTDDRGAEATPAIIEVEPNSEQAKVPMLEPYATECIEPDTVPRTVDAAEIVYATALTTEHPIPIPATHDGIGTLDFYAIGVEGGGPVAAVPVAGIDPAEVPGLYIVSSVPKVDRATSSEI